MSKKINLLRLVVTPFEGDRPIVSSKNLEFYLESSDDVCKILDGLKDFKCFYSLAYVSVLSSDDVINDVLSCLNFVS